MGGLLERPEWKSTQEFTRTGSSYVKQDSGALRVFCVSRAEKSSIQGREPAAAEEKSGTEGSKKNWPPIRVRFLQHLLKSGMQGRATHGRTKIVGNTRNGRKRFWRNTALLGKQGHQAGIRLVGRETADGTSRNAAAQLHRCNHFFHACDRRAGKSLAVKLHIEAAIFCIADLDRSGILPRATKDKVSKNIPCVCTPRISSTKQESARAVSKEAAEFPSNPAGSKCAAVHVSGDYQNSFGLPGNDQRLRDGERIEQSKARATDVQRSAIFAHHQSGMKLRRERWVIVMRFAGGSDPV